MAEVVDADPEVDPAGLHCGEPDLGPKAVARDRRANPRREQQIVTTARLGSDVSRDLVQPPCRTPNVRGSLFFGSGFTRQRSPVGEFFLDVSTIASSTPEYAVDCDCASGLVSSLVINVVVKLAFSLRRLRPADQQRWWNAVRAVHMIMVVALRGHIGGTRLGESTPHGRCSGGRPIVIHLVFDFDRLSAQPKPDPVIPAAPAPGAAWPLSRYALQRKQT